MEEILDLELAGALERFRSLHRVQVRTTPRARRSSGKGTAPRLAVRFLSHLEALPPEGRVRALRRLGRRSWASQRSCLDSGDVLEKLGLLLAV
jgi:hypothetical protein